MCFLHSSFLSMCDALMIFVRRIIAFLGRCLLGMVGMLSEPSAGVAKFFYDSGNFWRSGRTRYGAKGGENFWNKSKIWFLDGGEVAILSLFVNGGVVFLLKIRGCKVGGDFEKRDVWRRVWIELFRDFLEFIFVLFLYVEEARLPIRFYKNVDFTMDGSL